MKLPRPARKVRSTFIRLDDLSAEQRFAIHLADQILTLPPLDLAVEMNVYPGSFRELVETVLEHLERFQAVGVGARIMDLSNTLVSIPATQRDLL